MFSPYSDSLVLPVWNFMSSGRHPFIQIVHLLILYTPRNRLQRTQLQLQICVQHALGIPVGRNLSVFQIVVSSSATITNQEEELSVQIPLLRYKILGSKTAVQDTHWNTCDFSSCSNYINMKFYLFLCWQCQPTSPFPSSSWWLLLSSSTLSQPVPQYHKEKMICEYFTKTCVCY